MIPDFIYGTAWKENRTEALVIDALETGFRAIDTANQRKHYFEEGAGHGIRIFLRKWGVSRKDLFIQTKFTYARGQDHRKPYDEKAGFAEQVKQSLESSLSHLGTDYVDSYVLHGPYGGHGIGAPDREVWAAMSALKSEGKALEIGISNVTLPQLAALFETSDVKPRFVQNRCFARSGWDRGVREYCRANGIGYQGFSLLTANWQELGTESVHAIARRHGKTIAQIVFRFCRQIGMIPLTGTSSRDHMAQDLDLADFELSDSEVQALESVGLLR